MFNTYIHNMAYLVFSVVRYLAFQLWGYLNDKEDTKKLKEQKKRAQELKKQKEEELTNKLNEDAQNFNNDDLRSLRENYQEIQSYQTAEEEIQDEISKTQNNFYSWSQNQIITIGINMVILRFNGTVQLAERAYTLLSNQSGMRAIRQGINYLGLGPPRRRLRNH